MKAPSPAFSLYPKDIESDERCKAMTHSEFGMYMRLLLNCWTEGSIPADPIRLQRLLKVSSKTFNACWPAIEACFTPAGDRLTQSRLEEERTRQRERSLLNSERGRKGGRPLEPTPEEKPRLSPGKAEPKPEKSLPSPSPFPSAITYTGIVAAATEAPAADDPFKEKPEDRERAIAELGALCAEIGRKEGREVRDVLMEASRTPRGAVITNPAAVSLDWICQTIARLKAKGQPIISANNRQAFDAIDRVTARMIAQRDGTPVPKEIAG